MRLNVAAGRGRVRRREDRAQHERRFPAQPIGDRVGDDSDGARRHEHEDERQRDQLGGGGAQLCGEASKPADCSSGGRNETDHLRHEFDPRQARHETDRDAPDDEHDRVRNPDQVGKTNEHRRGEQHRDEELDVRYGP